MMVNNELEYNRSRHDGVY